MSLPQCCERRAYEFFADQLDVLETTDGLVNAAIAISMHAFDDVRPSEIIGRLADFSDQVAGRVRGRRTQAVLAHLHEVLFEEAGFRGNTDDYFSPLNSYLPAVVATRRGIPITLGLVYKAVAEPLGLEVQGINAPGHFLIRVRGEDDQLIVDPFFGGRLLSHRDVLLRCGQLFQTASFSLHDVLRPASHRDWLVRMLGNLENVFASNEFHEDLRAMVELRELLV